MIESKCNLVGVISTKQSLEGEVSNAIKYLDPITQEKTVDSSIELQEITPDKDYTGLSKVTINPVTSQIDQNIKAENIKQGVDILGITGTANLLMGEELTINKNGEYIPTEPLNAYTKVIADIPNDTSDATAAAEDIAKGKTAYISTGIVEGTGNMAQKIEKGLVINSYDEEGYPTDVSIVGITEIPNHYFNAFSPSLDDGYVTVFSRINLSLPDNVESIGEYAFYGCGGATINSFPETLKTINMYGFYSCYNLTLTELPNSITKIGKSAFAFCSNLALKKLPSEIKTIEERSFYTCSNLAIQTIPSKVTSIGQSAFYNCSSIKTLSIAGAITSIGGSAFYGCTNLSVLRLLSVTKVPTISSNSLTNTLIAKGTGYIYVPTELLDSFKSATNWSKYADRIYGV